MQSWAAKGMALALSELHLQYSATLRSGDTFTGSLTVQKLSAARLVLSQQLVRHADDIHDAPEVSICRAWTYAMIK